MLTTFFSSFKDKLFLPPPSTLISFVIDIPKPLTLKELGKLAKSLAGRHTDSVAGSAKEAAALGRVIKKTRRHIHQRFADLGKRSKVSQISDEEEIFLDNYTIILQSLDRIKNNFIPSFYERLPRLKDTHNSKVKEFTREMVETSDYNITDQRLVYLVNQYQQHQSFSNLELWAIPLVLEAMLIFRFRDLMENVNQSKRDNSSALLWLSRLFSAYKKDEQDFSSSFREMFSYPPYPSRFFIAKVVEGLTKEGISRTLIQSLVSKNVRTRHSIDDIIAWEKITSAHHFRQIKNIIASLRNIQSANWAEFVEQVSITEKVLLQDPAGIYPQMSPETRSTYRYAVEEIAYRTKKTEEEVAREALDQCRNQKTSAKQLYQIHVGNFLIDEGRPELEKHFNYHPTGFEMIRRYLLERPSNFFFSLLLLAAVSSWFILWSVSSQAAGTLVGKPLMWFMGILLILPAANLATQLSNLFITRFFPPHTMPKMNFDAGIPQKSRTMIVIPTMLSSKKSEVKNLTDALERCYLANTDPNIYFGLILAFQDSTAPTEDPTEAEKEVLKLIETSLLDLNRKYSPNNHKFHLFFRKRLWNFSESKWIEWERKRGKLIEFNHLLKGSTTTSFTISTAGKDLLASIKYVITLDRDVVLPTGSAKKLVATAAHPLNDAIVDVDLGRVTHGYGVIQPRMSIPLRDRDRSIFYRLFSGATGWDSYSGIVSDVFEDIYKESLYLGKGIYNVDVFHQLTSDKFPENILLSHDFLEGFYARTAYASDIQVFEGFPANYHSFSNRHHRWVRGDWQALGWLSDYVKDQNGNPQRNPLTLFQRWKIFENASRSLVLPSTFLLLILSWVFLGESSIIITLAAVIYLNFSSLLDFIMIHFRSLSLPAWRYSISQLLSAVVATCESIFLNTIFICHQVTVTLDAIARSLYRLLVSHKKLLEWVPSHQVELVGGNSLVYYFQYMRGSVVLCLVLISLVHLFFQESASASLPLLYGWAMAPIAAFIVSRPNYQTQQKPDVKQQRYLRKVSRKIWRFFDDFVGETSHHLPPDNYQFSASPQISGITSITNIGFYLLSIVSAHDLGFITTEEAVTRIHNTLTTLDGLEGHKGHLFNWYEIKNLKPAHPLYISTVDSGNLAVSLITLKQSVAEMTHMPLLRIQHLAAVLDEVEIIEDELNLLIQNNNLNLALAQSLFSKLGDIKLSVSKAMHRKSPEWYSLISPLRTLGSALSQDSLFSQPKVDQSKLEEVRYWCGQINDRLEKYYQLHEKYLPDLDTNEIPEITASTTLFQLQTHIPDAVKKLVGLTGLTKAQSLGAHQAGVQLEQVHKHVLSTIKSIQNIATKTHNLVEEMDFSFLYNKKRHLFAIGYNLGRKRFDRAHYDLLCSESRLTSFWAISKGDIPIKNWIHLGRPLTTFKGQVALLSWGGSIFETFMPNLFIPNIKDSLFWWTYKTVLAGQIDYGRQQGIPWGISESSFSRRNIENRYKYRSFGVPFLGLAHNLSKYLVVSPYSTFLALGISPDAAYKNLHHLESVGATGKYGFYESIDYTQYPGEPEDKTVVEAFLCHHQAISLISLGNYLNPVQMSSRFMQETNVQASAFLLEESAPSQVNPTPVFPIQDTLPHDPPLEILKPDLPYSVSTPITNPKVSLLANPNFRVFFSSRGSGFSQFRNLTITRRRDDSVQDNAGTFFYIKDLKFGYIWSAGFQPTQVIPTKYDVSLSENSSRIVRIDHQVESQMRVLIFPHEDVEMRIITLTNLSEIPRFLELTSYNEITLFPHLADLAHPQFANLFVNSERLENREGLIFSRTNLPADQSVFFVHQLVHSERTSGPTSFSSDRMKFIGRGRSVQLPHAVENSSFAPPTDFPLDPIAAISTRLRLDPRQEVNFYFLNIAAVSESQAKALSAKFSSVEKIESELETVNRLSTTILDNGNEIEISQKLTSALMYGKVGYAQSNHEVGKVRSDLHNWQQNLWKFGVSGDYPIITINLVSEDEDWPVFLRQTLRITSYLLKKGLNFESVVIMDTEEGYSQIYFSKAQEVVKEFEKDAYFDGKGRMFLFRRADLSPSDIKFLTEMSIFTLDSQKGSLTKQVESIFKKL